MSYGPCKLCNTRYNPCAVAIYNPNGNDATKCPAFEEGDTYHSDGYYGLVWPDPPEGTLTWGCCGNKDKESAGCKTRTTEKLVVCKHDDPRYYHYHLANLQETTLYNKAVATRRAIRARKFYHLRDWTTVSHAWCPASAKLSTLTVLMVGETYKRGLLPRLPMDCWYRILNMVPRHKLRQGYCEPIKERAALAQYLAILQDARTVIAAGAVAGAAGAAGAADSTAAAAAVTAAAAAPQENEVAPKLPASAYILFCVDTRVQLAQEQPELGAIEVMKELGDKWKAAGDEARKPYVDANATAKLKYIEEQAAYKLKLVHKCSQWQHSCCCCCDNHQ